jgi:hypothetical protein
MIHCRYPSAAGPPAPRRGQVQLLGWAAVLPSVTATGMRVGRECIVASRCQSGSIMPVCSPAPGYLASCHIAAVQVAAVYLAA